MCKPASLNTWPHSVALNLRNLFFAWQLAAFQLCAAALEVNQANVAELDSLKGMGPSLSAKLIEARNAEPFKNWQDLMQRISGMGTKKALQFSNQGLTVQGTPFDHPKTP